MATTFTVDDATSARAKVWMDKHDCEAHSKELKFGRRYSGAIGGAYTWCFTGTSIGDIVSVRCSCGAEEDITDWEAFG